MILTKVNLLLKTMSFSNDNENSCKWEFEALSKKQPIYVQRQNKISVLMKKLAEEKIIYVRSQEEVVKHLWHI